MRPSLKFLPALVLAMLACAAILISVSQRQPEEIFLGLESLRDQMAAPAAEHADAANCLACHASAHAAWLESHHAVANADFTEADRLRLRADPTGLQEQRGIDWDTSVTPPVHTEPGTLPHPIVGTIGITPLIQNLLLAPDGRIQAHDVAWDTLQDEWFSIFEGEAGPPRQTGEWGHWTGQGMNWDANCAWCHMTEYRKNYDVQSDTYQRTWSAMAISCAQCHPGMETHMAQIRNGNNSFKEELSPVQHMENCATCHSRREHLTADRFVAGDDYEDHFQLTLADIAGIYHPDGQVIGENYVYGSLQMSRMGTAGVTCMDCHEPHSGGFVLPTDNNALCMRCHGSGLKDAPRIDPLAHSRHPANSTGNLCVECHMPSTNFMGRDPRRDHSFSNPDPLLTLELGIPNACSTCHTTESNEWALKHAHAWYGEDMNQARRARARLVQAVWDAKEGTQPQLRDALRAEKNRFWKATYIALFRQTGVDAESYRLISSFLEDPDPLVRTAVVQVLGLQNIDPAQRGAVRDDPVRSVRIAALLSEAPGSLNPELLEYLEQTADSTFGALRLATHAQARGDPGTAMELARRATRFDRLNPEAYRLAAIQLHTSGDTTGARKLLLEALELAPEDPTLLFNIGLLAAESADLKGALGYLQRAVAAEPTHEDAWYNLIVLYWQNGDMATARLELEEALRALPRSRRLGDLARQMPTAN